MKRQEKSPVEREDLYEFRFVSEASLSPDGTMAVCVVNQASKEDNTYHSSIWSVDLETKEKRLLASRGEVKKPVWLDSERILFASSRDKEDNDQKEKKPETRYYEISIHGGEATPFMTVPLKADGIRFMGDGLWLVSTVADENEIDADKVDATMQNTDGTTGAATAGDGAGKEQDLEEYKAVRGKDYEIYEELPFWFNGKGITNRKRPALYVFSQKDQSLKRITLPFLETVSYDVSADHQKIAFAGPVYTSIRHSESGLYLYDLKQEQMTQLVPEDRYGISNVCFLGNEKIFYSGTEKKRAGANPRFYQYDLTRCEIKQLPFYDMEIGSSVGSDAKFGSGRSLCYDQAEEKLYLTKTSWGDSYLMMMDQQGQMTQVSREFGAVTGFDVAWTADGRKQILLSAMRGQHLTELYLLDPDSGKEEKLTGFHDEYLETHQVVEPERFRYESKNGYEMEAYVIHPADYVPGKKYPAVFEIHGGPKGVSGTVFFHEFQCLASAGYFVFYGNPRGSDGRGEAYADLTEKFGADDFQDLMELSDQILKHYPDIDEKRVGICGGSYGGFMCNWMEGHTDRFAAAVSQRSISNYLSKCLYTDIGYYANRLQMGAYPWEDFEKVWSMSPLKEAPKGRTPLLLLQSDEDYRCWMGDAIQMFSAVKRQGVDARMVLFHGENHELSRSGKPQNRITRLKELMNWFGKYLTNEEGK